MAPVSFRTALGFWWKLGWISFGGPAGQIAIMHQELVERRRWISERRFLHALNYCMLLPGPEAQQLATYIGWLFHRTWGGIAAGALFVLPSLAILIALSWVYVAFGQLPLVAGAFYGIKPAVVAIVAAAVHRIGARTLTTRTAWAIAALAFLSIFAFGAPFPAIVAAAALAGWGLARFAPRALPQSSPHQGRTVDPLPVPDEDAPPPHTRFRLSRLLVVAGAGAGLWAAPMLVLGATFGWSHTFLRMAWFFTTAAWLTFGGAYAVLPYVYQGAVERYGWLTSGQMIDGLALGESTPGPLIMVVAFVGFVGGYGQDLLSPAPPFWSGAAAAVLVTWFTFLPSFVLILAGGPLVESTRGDWRFVAPLSAITAAVVGVVLNLALFFAYRVGWPDGFPGRFDWVAAAITVGAAALLRRGNVVVVIAACAAVGLLLAAAGYSGG